MPRFSRLTNTDAISGRSFALPVSFSTIDARISASYGRRERQVGRASRPRRVEPRVQRAIRAPQQREVAAARREEIRVRERTGPRGADSVAPRRAAARHRAGRRRRGRRRALSRSARLSVGERRALDDRHRRLRDVALRQLREQLGSVMPAFDLVAARLDRAIDAAHARQQRQRVRDAGSRRHRAARARRSPAARRRDVEVERAARQRQRLRGTSRRATAARAPRRLR